MAHGSWLMAERRMREVMHEVRALVVGEWQRVMMGMPRRERPITHFASDAGDLAFAHPQRRRQPAEPAQIHRRERPLPAQRQRERIATQSGGDGDEIVGRAEARIAAVGVDHAPVLEVGVAVAADDHAPPDGG